MINVNVILFMMLGFLWLPENNVIDTSKKVPCNEGTCIFALYDSSEMEIKDNENKSIVLKQGDKLVFKYEYYPTARNNAYYVIFEIPRERRFFNFENNRLNQLNAHVGELGANNRENVLQLREGRISGYKIANGLWHVEFDILTSKLGDHVEFNATEVFGRE